MSARSLSQIIQRGILVRMLIPLVLLILFITFIAAVAQKRRAESASLDIMEAVARNVGMYIDDSFLVLEHAAKQTSRNDSTESQLYAHLNEIRSIYPKFERLIVLDSSYNQIFQVPRDSLNLDFPLQLETRSQERLLLSRPVPSRKTGKPVIFIGVPLPNNQLLVGVLGLGSLDGYIKLPSSETIGKVLVTDAFGNLVSHPDRQQVDRHVNVGGEPWFTLTARGQQSVLYEEDGTLYVSTSVNVPIFNWKVFGQTKALRVFMPVLIPVIVSFIVLMLFAFLSTVLLRREFERRIEQPTRKFVGQVSLFAGDDANSSASIESFSELATFAHAFDVLGQRINDREQRLLESERRLLAVFEQAAVGLALCRIDGSIYRVNQKFSDITGYSPETLSRLDFRTITHPDDLDADEANLKKLLDGSIKSYTMEKRYIRQDGSSIWVQLTASLAKDALGSPLHILGVVEDIAQRKKTETALWESEKRFRSVFEQAPTGIMLYGQDGRIIEINAAGSSILGLSFTDKVEGCDISTLLPGFEKQQPFSQNKDSELLSVEAKYISPFRQQPLILKMNHLAVLPGLFLCLFEDITLKRRAADALQESEERYRCVFDEALDMIFLIDADTQIILDCNKETLHALGYSKSEIVGQHKRIIFSDNISDSINNTQDTTGNTYATRNSTTIKSKDGKLIDVAIKSSPFNLQGRLVHSAIVRDVTALKRDEALLRESLAEKVIMLREIHHRVKNNLQIISSLLYLQSGQTRDPETQELFKESRNRIASMALVHEELYRSGDFSRVELSAYLEKQISRLVSTLTNTKDIQLRFDMNAVYLAIDRAIPFGLIINELATNCIKHAFVGRDQGEIHISIHTDQAYVLVTVRDNGVGLPQEFSMTQTSTLGMELVNRLCAQIKATLSVQSDNGAMFSLRFPLEVN